ncbi:S26 family signal peptidase [Parahaliea mediterranea]|uniref:S26 family signal peptidase n=1 Tax=Parahaliea mediterranea TaxID=651086 RepID=UPI000E2F4404|nr:S26 family signal peptidase [Parahaliea mediterranea]
MPLRLFRVTGHSMCPYLNDGDYVVTRRCTADALREGDVIAVAHQRLGPIIKRIAAIQAGHTLQLAGDNSAASTASECIGAVPGASVLGRVVWRIRR